MDTRTQILEKISQSSLSQADCNLWQGVLAYIPDNLQPHVLNAFNQDPDAIQKLTENLKTKIAAMETGDSAEWKKILEQEKVLLAS